MRMKYRSVALAAAIVCVGATQAEKPAPKTPENLAAAFKGESNVHAKYLVFAKKAEEEGYAGAARLFRAISRAEQVHADSHGAVIKKTGELPKMTVETTVPRTTAENLASAMQGETWERDSMYPPFIAKASEEQRYDAAQSFLFAQSAEGDHAGLYEQVRKNMEQWKAADKDVFVCPTCGRTVLKVDSELCPVCATPTEKYEKNPTG